MNRLRSYWIDLRASLWFVPSLIVLGSMLAAVLMTETDGRVGLELAKRCSRLFGASADASRAILAAIATSMVTVAGVVFSITIVALSLTSTQYSPRVLRNFMRDRPTQVVQKLVKALHTPEVKKFIQDKYKGAVVPAF